MSEAGRARVTLPKYVQYGAWFTNVPQKIQREIGLSEGQLRTYSLDQLLDLLSMVHPDVSFAVWNFMRLGNSGYDIQCYKMNGDIHERGMDYINKFTKSLEQPQGQGFVLTRSLDRIINQFMKSLILRGALSGEVVLNENYSASYIAPVDPNVITFDVRDNRIVPRQVTTILDTPTFFYEGLDSFIDDPAGISPILSAIQIVFFQMQILMDLKAVVHNQGYPKYDIKIVEEVLLKRMPPAIKNDDKKKEEWLTLKLNEIINLYNKLEPDDAFVHFDSTEVNSPSAGKAMIDPEKLMNVVNEQMNMALKSLSTILGRRSNGNTETFAKVEIKLYLKGLEAIQWVISNVMSRMLTMILNMGGIQGNVQFKFKPCEIMTENEKVTYEQIRLMNIQFKYNMGWISQDEAAREAVGHKPDAPEPRVNENSTNSDGSIRRGQRQDNPASGGGNN